VLTDTPPDTHPAPSPVLPRLQARKLQLAKRHSNVRSEAGTTPSSDVTTPVGTTPWERVTSVINFNFEAHQHDMSKYKSILLGCKAKNTPVACA
jgi:hypothetical protein